MKDEILVRAGDGSPCFEVGDDVPLWRVADRLWKDDLPDKMSLMGMGIAITFGTKEERFKFAIGLETARNLLSEDKGT